MQYIKFLPHYTLSLIRLEILDSDFLFFQIMIKHSDVSSFENAFNRDLSL